MVFQDQNTYLKKTVLILKRILQRFEPPKILKFNILNLYIIQGGVFTLSWTSKNAILYWIPGFGFTARNYRTFDATVKSKRIKLISIGFFGYDQKEVEVNARAVRWQIRVPKIGLANVSTNEAHKRLFSTQQLKIEINSPQDLLTGKELPKAYLEEPLESIFNIHGKLNKRSYRRDFIDLEAIIEERNLNSCLAVNEEISQNREKNENN